MWKGLGAIQVPHPELSMLAMPERHWPRGKVAEKPLRAGPGVCMGSSERQGPHVLPHSTPLHPGHKDRLPN